MKSLVKTRLFLALVSSAVIAQLLVETVSCGHVSHRKDDGDQDSMKGHHLGKRHVHINNKRHHPHDEHHDNTDSQPLEVLNHQTLGYLPVCNWCRSVNFDPDRVPKVLPIASCCGTHLNNTGVTVNIHCETIYYILLVKQRIKDQTNDPNAWEDKWLKVPAGCTPARPVTKSGNEAITTS